MDTKTFDTFRKIVYDTAGININDSKGALVAARVGKRMRELSLSDDKQYLELLLNDASGEEMINLLDVISTNVTSFFRESNHFEILGDIMARLAEKGQRKFRIWCAAASTGEEPYTIAMTMLDKLGPYRADIKILATDISTRVLAQCAKGQYTALKIAPVPESYVRRFFEKTGSGNSQIFSVRQEVKDIVKFTRLNLAKPPFPMSGPLDAIFCRNVMIYFDNVVRKSLLEECYRLTIAGGHLFVGHAESLTGILSGYKAVMPSVYVKG